MHDLYTINPKIKVYGVDISNYAIKNALPSVRKKIKKINCKKIPYNKNFFDCVVAINVVHNLELRECKNAIKEIQRISRGRAFIQVDAYRNKQELKVLKKWILTAKTYLKPNEWKKVFKECGYTGYYDFTILKIDKWLKLKQAKYLIKKKNKKKAIFLDRDGTLIYSKKKSKFKIRPPYEKKELKFYKDIKYINKFKKKYIFIIVTNQPDVKRGFLKEEFNNYINTELKKKIPYKKIYMCFQKNSNCSICDVTKLGFFFLKLICSFWVSY